MKKIITVLHDIHPTFGMTVEGQPAVFREVAKVEIPIESNLDLAFRLTNTISQSWLKNPEIKSQLTACRSTSVGDVFETEGKFFLVQNVGFQQIEKPTME
jgi:hypothetical protein